MLADVGDLSESWFADDLECPTAAMVFELRKVGGESCRYACCFTLWGVEACSMRSTVSSDVLVRVASESECQPRGPRVREVC